VIFGFNGLPLTNINGSEYTGQFRGLTKTSCNTNGGAFGWSNTIV